MRPPVGRELTLLSKNQSILTRKSKSDKLASFVGLFDTVINKFTLTCGGYHYFEYVKQFGSTRCEQGLRKTFLAGPESSFSILRHNLEKSLQ